MSIRILILIRYVYSPYNVVHFFFNDTATTEIYTLSLHDALPISSLPALTGRSRGHERHSDPGRVEARDARQAPERAPERPARSEEHTSELQSRQYLVCRLLLEKKKKNSRDKYSHIYHRQQVITTI